MSRRFTKQTPNADAEARGLAAIAASGTSLRTPRVEEVTGDSITLEWLERGECVDADGRLGIGLAQLHGATALRFGFEVDTFCGPTRQPNAWRDDFVTFFVEQRLAVVLELAHRRGAVDDAGRRATEALFARLPDQLAACVGPARLIHGDLWSGNVIVTAEGPALIDPSAAYSHPEAEIGMMTLFGGFSTRTFAAYDEVLPRAPGWDERLPVFQLYHLLNHAALFGGAYGAQAMRIVRLR